MSAAPPLSLDLGTEMTAQQLLRRSRRLLWFTLLPLLCLVVVLGAWQARAQWQHGLVTAAADARTQRAAFDVIVRDANRHVADMSHWLRQALLDISGAPAPMVAQGLRPRLDALGRADGYSLDELSPLLTAGMAQLMWPQPLGKPQGAVLYQAQALAAEIEVAHRRNPDFVSSYFFGERQRYALIFPWAPTRSLVEENGARDMGSALQAWYGHELVTAGLAQNNPARQPYWTAPYLGAAGKALMVSHAMPVYIADELNGIVGTEIRLGTLERQLERLPGAPWQAWVIDERGHVLADRQRPLAASAPAGGVVAKAADRLPAGWSPAGLAQATSGTEQAVALADHQVVALRISGAPWTLVLAAPNKALAWSTLPQVLPYTAIALGLMLVWWVGQDLLRRQLLTPVLELLGYLQQLAENADAPAPRLDARWQPWVRRVRQNFDDMRSAAQRERRADLLKSAIVDHAQAAVVVADGAGRIVEYNPTAEAMLGWTREQAIGSTLRELLTPERFRASLDAAMQAIRRGQAEHLLGHRLQRVCLCADGRELPVETVIWVTEVEGVEYLTAQMTDQTAARAAAEVIERQRDALRHSEKLGAMGGLLAGVAHELNNPLSIVMGRASLLQEKTEGTALEADAARIRDAAERCGRIVRTFLNMARQRPSQRAPVQLNTLARAAADMLGYTLRSHGITLELRLDERLPELQADGDQLGQVVLNLIVNAQQALAAQTGWRCIVVASGMDAADGSVWLRIRDSGLGVPEQMRERIFEPFFTTKAEGIGTGIGLSVSRSIVVEHGGELLLEPAAAGQGASFLMTLPQVATVPADDNQGTGPDAGPTPRPAGATEAARVLVVDDEPEVADLVRAELESAGHEVATADSGVVALAMLEVARFDAVVTDLRMPQVDGAELWRRLRERYPALARRVVFLTGDTLSPAAQQFLDETGCGRLEKPFTRADLLARVSSALHAEVPHA